MEEKASCIMPKPEMTEEFNWVGRSRGIVWLGETISAGFEFTYKSDGNQMSFLQLLSSKASQRLTYHCKNSIAVFDATKKTYKNALKLKTTSDVELSARGSSKLRYKLVKDGCKAKSRVWDSTTIIYRTDKPQRLPITDIGLRDVGKADQSFKVEVGPVCYT